MKIPVIAGTIRRRFLLNFRIDPEVMRGVLPDPFRPQVHAGFGVAGICLIRLEGIRPKCSPIAVGLSSENAAHRFAVEWDEAEGVRTGVYIPRRDTDSLLSHLAGGRIFPGVHHRATFQVKESNREFAFSMASADGEVAVGFTGRTGTKFPSTSIFASLEEASTFFEAGSLGYSLTRRPGQYDGLRLNTKHWAVSPFDVQHVHSSYFSNRSLFPDGSVVFDHALLMRDIAHEWQSAEDLCCKEAV